MRSSSFSVRVVNWWNDLPNSVVLSPINVNTFKNHRDKFFQGKDIMYNFDDYMDHWTGCVISTGMYKKQTKAELISGTQKGACLSVGKPSLGYL